MNGYTDKPIVVPMDFSEESVRAVGEARKLAANDAQIHVIHVIAELEATEPGVIWGTIDDEHRKQHAKEQMQKRLASAVTDEMTLEVGIGDPGHVVVDRAETLGAGLIVVPSHGRRGIARLLLGSVAERIVRLAHCPVFILKG